MKGFWLLKSTAALCQHPNTYMKSQCNPAPTVVVCRLYHRHLLKRILYFTQRSNQQEQLKSDHGSTISQESQQYAQYVNGAITICRLTCPGGWCPALHCCSPLLLDTNSVGHAHALAPVFLKIQQALIPRCIKLTKDTFPITKYLSNRSIWFFTFLPLGVICVLLSGLFSVTFGLIWHRDT